MKFYCTTGVLKCFRQDIEEIIKLNLSLAMADENLMRIDHCIKTLLLRRHREGYLHNYIIADIRNELTYNGVSINTDNTLNLNIGIRRV